jgi:hypothetical protein
MQVIDTLLALIIPGTMSAGTRDSPKNTISSARMSGASLYGDSRGNKKSREVGEPRGAS